MEDRLQVVDAVAVGQLGRRAGGHDPAGGHEVDAPHNLTFLLSWEHMFEEGGMSGGSPSPDAAPSGVYMGSPDERPRAGYLIRLSTLPVAYDPFSLENQRRLNHEAAARNDEHIPPEFEFSEHLRHCGR